MKVRFLLTSVVLLQAVALKNARAWSNEYCPGDKWIKASLNVEVPKAFNKNLIRNDEESFSLVNHEREPIYLLENNKEFYVCKQVKDFKSCVEAVKSKSGMQRVNMLKMGRNFKYGFENDWTVMEYASITVDGNCRNDCEIKSESISVAGFLQAFRNDVVDGKSLNEIYEKEGPGRPKDMQVPKNKEGLLYLEKGSKEYRVPYQIKFSLNNDYDPKKEGHSGKCQ